LDPPTPSPSILSPWGPFVGVKLIRVEVGCSEVPGDGDDVGTGDGTMEGDKLGIFEGTCEGDALGDSDGFVVGTEEGISVNLAVGMIVGLREGTSEGFGVGNPVGIDEYDWLGGIEGLPLGFGGGGSSGARLPRTSILNTDRKRASWRSRLRNWVRPPVTISNPGLTREVTSSSQRK
jgi:hypothetical protein